MGRGNIQNGAAGRDDKRQTGHPSDDQPSTTRNSRSANSRSAATRPFENGLLLGRICLCNLRRVLFYAHSLLINIKFRPTWTLARICVGVNLHASTVVTPDSPLVRIKVREGHDARRNALLVAVELTDLDLGTGCGMSHVHATQRDHSSEDG